MKYRFEASFLSIDTKIDEYNAPMVIYDITYFSRAFTLLSLFSMFGVRIDIYEAY